MPLLLGRCFRCSRRISPVIRCGFSAKKVNKILTGLQPTGVPHLGNYLGVIRPLCRIQSSPDVSSVLITIADLHALTSTGGMNLSYGILELSAALIACFQQEKGDTLKKNEPVIFLQSAVRGHTELAWILASCCSLPVSDAFCSIIFSLCQRLAHLPQWRDKSHSSSLKTYLKGTSADISDPSDPFERASVGLFMYPVLQASDILLYNADLVPVGADQATHIELARDLVRVATNRWPTLKPFLNMPESITLGVPKIHSLREPTKKMSKSDSSPGSAILLTDSPDTIRTKIRRSQTDSLPGVTYDSANRPGVSNLIRTLAAIEDRELEDVISRASQWTKETLKSCLTDALVKELGPISQRIAELKESAEGRLQIEARLQKGAAEAQKIADERLELIYSLIGCTLPQSRFRLETKKELEVTFTKN
ncbi:Tryptophan--tRNA ligase [Fasciolopsis buskii]|uniref:tryptophan--tRNA ligase n=1 Tax=Fasciolopsis buskii TaxID=27845 RepID=A0A8E0VHQ0_9TREM|nr:Tryptophan--tRNA ligase [Fasciolopsis buski]